jgi:phytoene synthase
MPRIFPDATWRSDVAACRALLRDGSRTFFAASFLLPRRVREPASALYAFCRLADDAVDLRVQTQGAIADLERRLDAIYRGMPGAHPADRALTETVSRYGIPRALPEALLEGLAWDAEGRTYATLAELEAYAARVAGSVGAMMALLMGVREEMRLARACDLGIAMQLTNIARDVGEDARAGRLYLPRDWMHEAGLDPDAFLQCPEFTPALGKVIARLLDSADRLYARADAGIAGLPASCRPGIRAARMLYAEIGHELRRNGLDSVSTRTIVPARRKLTLLQSALQGAPADRAHAMAACLTEAHFLVNAVEPVSALDLTTGAVRWWDFHTRYIWVIELFHRLEARNRYSESDATREFAA